MNREESVSLWPRGGVTAFLAVLLLSAAASPILAAELTPEEERGKSIYFTGRSPSGKPITAWFGEDLIQIPGETSTCGSCHGYDGLGRPESGVIPTNVTWKYLTKSYGHVHPNGVEHGPFTVESLKEYMVTGVYHGGQKGDPSMPVYEMPEEDLDDLIAFMKRLGEVLDPGLTETAIRVGTLLPGSGPLASIGGAIRGVLEAYFSEINKAGGIFGRKVELLVHSVSPGEGTAAESVRAWLSDSHPFALVSSFTPGVDTEVQTVVAEEGVPLVGPFTLYPIDDFSLNRNLFYLFSGLREQVRSLLRVLHTEARLENPEVTLVYPQTEELNKVIDGVEQMCNSIGWSSIRRVPFSSGTFDASQTVDQVAGAGADVVIFLGVERETRSFLEAAAIKDWTPYVLTPGVLAGRLAADAPANFGRRLLLAYPTLAVDRKPWGVEEISKLAAVHKLPASHIQTTVSAYSSAKVLAEAFRISGRDLSRRKLISVLEKFYQFQTGLTPPVTYNRNRRIGANGAYVVRFDPRVEGAKAGALAARWVEVQ